MQGVMGELAGGVEVPEQDMREGRATSRLSADDNAGAEPLMRISSGGERPADAYPKFNTHQKTSIIIT
jgi:hypothetical protein